MEKEFENLDRQMRKMKEKNGNKPKSGLANVEAKVIVKINSMLTFFIISMVNSICRYLYGLGIIS